MKTLPELRTRRLLLRVPVAGDAAALATFVSEMANYVPSNERSARLLDRLGFAREGYACAYLRLDGSWQDHVLTALTDDLWAPS